MPDAPKPDAPGSESAAQPPSKGHHLATLSHEGRFWDVYVEFDDDPRRQDSYGARLCFSPADSEDGAGTVRTATIVIQPSYEEVLHRARSFEDHQLASLLRSCLPD
jgi:hypothetical protein